MLAQPPLSFFLPGVLYSKFLSWVCLAYCTMKLKAHFPIFSVRWKSREGLGGTVSCKCCWIWIFYYLVCWQNYEKISPDGWLCFISTIHVASRLTCNGLERWKKSGFRRSKPLEKLAQYVVQSSSSLHTEFPHLLPSNIKHIRNWLHGLWENVV